jgi:hypothetical protein
MRRLSQLLRNAARDRDRRALAPAEGKAVLAVLALVAAQQSHAGLLDSPAPTLGGVPAQVVYRMGPIYYQPGQTDTIVTCTNADDAGIRLAIEVFDEADNPVGGMAQAALPARETITFLTSADMSRAGFLVIQGLPPLAHAKARVSATTQRLSCAAYHRVRASDGTTQEKALELIKKVHAPPTDR